MFKEVRKGKRVCVATYGHPTVCDATTEVLIKTCRSEGYAATVLPGISSVATLLSDLGIDPSPGLMVVTAQQLVESTRECNGRLDLIGRHLAHLVVLMPDAVGDDSTGEKLCSGASSLLDSPGWAEFLSLIERHYGSESRVVLYRAPIWSSVIDSSMISVPLVSLRCRSFVDDLVKTWGGDLGTLYVAGGKKGDRRPAKQNVARLQDPTKGDVGIVRPQVDPKKGLVSGFDIERSAWLRRWGCTDIKDACAAACNSDSSVSSLHLWPSGGLYHTLLPDGPD